MFRPLVWLRKILLLWFTHLFSTFVKELRTWGYRVLPLVGEFHAAPSPAGMISTAHDYEVATVQFDSLMKRLGLKRHEKKGNWKASPLLEHLGVIIYSVTKRFAVTGVKAIHVNSMAKELIRTTNMGRRRVTASKLRSFFCTCVAL